MYSFFLNLSGPLQSWAGPSAVKSRVDTQSAPSLRAIKGLLAAAYGMERGSALPKDLEDIKIFIHKEKDGRVVRDFQIISNRADETEFLRRIGKIVSEKGKWQVSSSNNTGQNDIVRRTYLADAHFIVQIYSEDKSLVERVRAQVLSPVWSPYLGRKAFPPTKPFILPEILDTETREEALRIAREKLSPKEEVTHE